MRQTKKERNHLLVPLTSCLLDLLVWNACIQVVSSLSKTRVAFAPLNQRKPKEHRVWVHIIYPSMWNKR